MTTEGTLFQDFFNITEQELFPCNYHQIIPNEPEL